MVAYRRRPSVFRNGEIGVDAMFRAPAHATRNEARNATHFSTWFATRFSTRIATWNSTRFATRFATMSNIMQQIATMFLRASFARGKVVQDNGIRCRRRVRSVAQMARLLKNVGFLALPMGRESQGGRARGYRGRRVPAGRRCGTRGVRWLSSRMQSVYAAHFGQGRDSATLVHIPTRNECRASFARKFGNRRHSFS